MVPSAILAVLLGLGFGPGQAPAQHAPDILSVHVANTSDTPRSREPVSFGVPIPASAGLFDVATLGVVDSSGAAVPCQAKALSRRGAPRDDAGSPLKWVLLTLMPDVDAKARLDFRVVVGGSTPAPGITVETPAGGGPIVVRTSKEASFSVPVDSFAPFASASVDGAAPVTSAGSLAMLDPEGRAIAPTVTTPTHVEESGPLRVVLAQRGKLGALGYTARWTFHAGRRDVALDFRLENPMAYGLFDPALAGGTQYFESLEIVQPVGGEDARATSPAGTVPLPPQSRFEVDQTFGKARPNDVMSGFSFTETLGGEKVAAGRRHAGAIDVSGTKGGVTVAVAHFYENHPKALAAADGAIRVGLFPAFGHGPEFRGHRSSPMSKDPIDPGAVEHYRFEGGRWKTHRIAFDFHAGARAPADVAAFAHDLDAPLAGWPEPAAVRTSLVLGPLWAERGLLKGDPSVDRFERFLDLVASDSGADPSGRLGRIGLPGFIDRGGTYGDRATYGWDNYGDIPWGEGWCNLHYDWPAAALSGFLRTGDPRLLARGCTLAEYRRDYGQNHSQDPREPWRGAAFYEKGWWHGNSIPGISSHNWILGLLLHYAITGDEGTREAAIENAAFLLRSGPGTWTGWWGSRIPGWAIDGLVDAWSFLGDPRYLAEARKGVARYEELELLDGGGGYHLNPSNHQTTVWMENILFIGAAKYALATGDPQALPLLARMRNWFKRSCILPPRGSAISMTLPAVYQQWSPATLGVGPTSTHHVWTMAACFSYAALLFDDEDDRMWATTLFDFAVRYWQEGPSPKARNPLNASSWSPITMRPLTFPNSESKVLANVLNFGAPSAALRALEGAR